MSRVTNYVLLVDLLNTDEEDSPPEIPPLNDDPRQRFVWVGRYAGGHKAFEASVALLAGNYVPVDDVCCTLVSVPWRHPDLVQLAYQEQEQDAFTLLSNEDIRARAMFRRTALEQDSRPCVWDELHPEEQSRWMQLARAEARRRP